MLKKLTTTAAAAGLCLAGAMVPASALDRLTIGTGPTGALYNQIGTVLSSLYQEKTGTPGAARPYTGTTSYLPLVHTGDIEGGILGGLETRDAYAGEGNFPQAMNNLRALLVVSRPSFQFFTRAEDGMTSVADLKGKSVVTKFRAIAGFDQVIDATLGSANITSDDVNGVTVAGIVDAIGAVRDGRVDSTMVALGIPPLREADAAIPGGIRVLTLGDNHEAVTDVLGLQVSNVGPSPAQVGIDAPIEAVSFNTFLNVGASMSDDDAYDLAKVIHSNWDEAQKALPPLRGMKPEWMVPARLSHPYHPGAIRYFKEQGMWSDDHQTQQDALTGNG